MKASQKWAVAVVVMVGPALALLDSTIVTVILPQLQEAFRTDFQTVTWTVTAYSLAQAAVIPIVGYVSDRTSSKLVFLVSLALFTVGSLLCALAPTKEAMFAFRVLQGLGGGALMPLSLAIIFRIFPPRERSTAIAIAGLPVTLAPALGPPLGGYLSATFNWNAVFLINVPIGIVGLLLSFFVVPGRDSDGSGDRKGSPQTQGTRKPFDLAGLLLAMVGFTALVYSINLAGSQGWGDPTVLTSLLGGVAVLVVFILVELRVSDPVLDLRLFLNYTFCISNGVLWIVVGVFSGSLFLLPLFFESVRGEAALATGTFLAVQGLGVGIGFVIAGFFYNRLGPRILTVLCLLIIIGGTYRLTQIDVHTTGESLQIWLFLRGFGVGAVTQVMQTLALAVVSIRGMARASSLLSVTRQVAVAVAVAALSTYMTEQAATHGVGPQATAAGMADTFWVILILGVVCIPLSLVMGNDPAIEAHKQAKQAQPSIEEVQIISNATATVRANGEEALVPQVSLWHYPEDDLVDGSFFGDPKQAHARTTPLPKAQLADRNRIRRLKVVLCPLDPYVPISYREDVAHELVTQSGKQ